MKTDALIEALAADVRPVRRGAVQRRLAAGLSAGALAALLLQIALLGIRPDLKEVASGEAYWASVTYAFSLAVVGFMFAVQLARPDCVRLRWSWLGLLPVLAIAWAASIWFLGAPDRLDQLLAPWACVPLILMLSILPYAGLVWGLRAFAPTRLSAAGAAAGLTAGAVAAAIYGLHSLQMSPAYVLTHCTASIALAAALGALAGPRLLRW